MQNITISLDTFLDLDEIKNVMGQANVDDTIKYLMSYAKAMRGPLTNWSPVNKKTDDEE